MTYDRIQRSMWKAFFDAVSKRLEGRVIGLEVMGLDLGDQRHGAELNLNGITYDDVDDTLYVSVEAQPLAHMNHAIHTPSEIWVEMNDAGLSRLVVMEPSGHQQVLELRDPLMLPAHASAAAHPA